MRIYRARSDENAVALAFRDRIEYERQSTRVGQPVELSGWTPPVVAHIRDGSAGAAPSDVVTLGVELAFSARAVDALGDWLQQSGQLLPLRSADGAFYEWHVTVVRDALQEDVSELQRFSSGRIRAVTRWAFRPEQLAGTAAFKVPQLPRAFTFVTEAFVDRVARAGLRGFAPQLVWSQD